MSLAGPGNVDNDAEKAERGSRRRARGKRSTCKADPGAAQVSPRFHKFGNLPREVWGDESAASWQ